jgi:hypothetical protein
VALQKNKVSNYFSKAPQAAQPPTPLSSVVQPARLSSSAFSAITPHVGLQAGTSNTSSTFMIGRDQDGEGADLAGSLIDRLRVAIRMLPITVLVGTEDDVLAQFARAPFVDPSEYDDAWEMVDKTLNGAIGYGMSVAAVSAIIRRGRFGMDGLCDWLETCILEYGINPNLLEGKVQRLLDAMSLLCVFFKFSPSYVIFTTLISGFMYRKLSDAESVIEISRDLGSSSRSTVIRNDALSVAPDIAISTSCPGYELVFPEGQSPYTSYPFAIHTIRVLPWMILLDGESMILMSADCTRHANTDDGSPLPCISCRNLHNHTVIMGIRHRALDGAHENTPWSFLSIVQLLRLLDQKNQQIAGLRLRGLNAGRSLAFRDRCLGSIQLSTIWKWEHWMIWWMEAYRDKKSAKDAQFDVKKYGSRKYTSHRKASETVARRFDELSSTN